MADCQHVFRNVSAKPGSGALVGVCAICGCRVTAWPGSPTYDDLKAALDKPKEPHA